MSNNFIQGKSIITNSVKIVLCIFLFFVLVQGVQAAETYVFVTKWGSEGTGEGQFAYPTGVAVDSEGNVYVADTENNRIQKFSSTGTFITKWGSEGTGDGQFNIPQGVAIDSSNNVYVAETNNNRIQKFNSAGTYLTQWGTVGSGDGQFNNPNSIAVDSSGNVYVADTGNYRIQKFSSTGTFITKWGSKGSGNGQFDYPYGVTVDSSGNVYVSVRVRSGTIGLELDYFYIQKFNSAGTYLTQWGSNDGSILSGVAVDSSSNVYVSSSMISRYSSHFYIQKFTSTGTFITRWGTTQGSGDGQFQNPRGIAVDSSGNVYVADGYINRIQKFALSSENPPVASFTGTPTYGTAPLTVTFTDNSTNTPTSWSWSFGDGSSSTSQNPWHVYAKTGTYTVKLTATNSAGSNLFTRTNYITVTSDVTKPTIIITSPKAGQKFTTATVTVNGTASDNVGLSKVEVKVGSGAWQTASGTTSWSKSVTLVSGSNKITVRATDTSGNYKDASVTVTYTKDVTKPTITITYPTSRQKFTTANVTVSGTASDAGGLSKVEVKVGSGAWQIASGTTSWSKSVTLAKGSNKITARATDTTGNYKDASVTVTYNK